MLFSCTRSTLRSKRSSSLRLYPISWYTSRAQQAAPLRYAKSGYANMAGTGTCPYNSITFDNRNFLRSHSTPLLPTHQAHVIIEYACQCRLFVCSPVGAIAAGGVGSVGGVSFADQFGAAAAKQAAD